MSERKPQSKQNTQLFIAIAVFLVLLLIFELFDIAFSSNDLISEMIQNTIFRIVGGVIFVLLMITSGFKTVFTWKRPFLVSMVFIIPALLIAVNNFPIIAYLDGRAMITESSSAVLIFALECISVGFFEEVIFRGLILVLLIQKFSKTKQELFIAIVLSSSIFGLMHLWNLMMGASFYDTFLQVGYSFLMGMMWAIVFLKTKNIWFVVFLHAAYNFFGRVVTTLGTVNNQFDTATIVLTVVLSVIVACSMFYVFLQLNVKEVQELSTLE